MKQTLSAFAVVTLKKKMKQKGMNSSSSNGIRKKSDRNYTSTPHPVKSKSRERRNALASLKTEEASVIVASSSSSSPANSPTTSINNKDYDKHEKLMDCTLGIEQLQESPLYRKQFQQSTPVSKYREASSEKEAKNSPTEDNGIISNSAGDVEMYEAPKKVPYMFDSRLEGKACFEFIIHPISCDRFFKKIWEKRPLLLKRHKPDYFNGLMTLKELEDLIEKRDMWFGKNIDVTTYIDGVRKTHNPPGRAYSSVVWDYYKNGCSVRLLNPQTFSRTIWKLTSTLQEFFGSFVGANIYLTPPGTQGFAPHYDDIEAFVLQLEGKKKWKLYNARSQSEVLPRESSENFKQGEIGEPIMQTELEPGDVLYFPRGIIHQAEASPDTHSLHITVSTSQRNTWGDLLTTMIPRALELAIEDDVEFRQSLPLDYLNFLGVAHSDLDSSRRKEIVEKIQHFVSKLIAHLPVDAAVDQMGKQFVYDCLPPVITKNEKLNSIHGCHVEMCDGVIKGKVEFSPNTKVKLLRANILRLVIEDSDVRIYHSVANSREYHETEPQFVNISPMLAPAVEYLIHMYPEYATIDSLPLQTSEDKMSIINILYDTGLILCKNAPK